jgi:hypothetical protein
VIFAAFLLPPGLMCLLLALGRYEEWVLRGPTAAQPGRHAGSRRHLSLVRGHGSSERPADESGRHRHAA